MAIASRNPATAREVASHHGIAKCHENIAELLADPSIEVLDIAVPPDAQPELIRQAVKQKHLRGILAQKPLAMTVPEARECVELCRQAGIALAVTTGDSYAVRWVTLLLSFDVGARLALGRRTP